MHLNGVPRLMRKLGGVIVERNEDLKQPFSSTREGYN